MRRYLGHFHSAKCERSLGVLSIALEMGSLQTLPLKYGHYKYLDKVNQTQFGANDKYFRKRTLMRIGLT